MKLVVKVMNHLAWRGHKMVSRSWWSYMKSTAWRKEMVKEYPARRSVNMVSGLE